MDEKMNRNEKVLLVIFVIVLIVGVIQVSILYFGADEVNCNFFWCEFKTTVSEIRQDCYMNGEIVDCDRIKEPPFPEDYDTIEEYREAHMEWERDMGT